MNLLKKTWGEQIVGNFGMGVIFTLLALMVFLASVPVMVVAISIESVMLIIATVAFFVLTLVFLGLINSTLKGIYVAAVYRYAAEGEASGFFSEEMVRGAFRPKS